MTDLDSPEKTTKRKKLPPITDKTGDEEGEAKPARKKKRTATDNAGGSVDKSAKQSGDGSPTRRRRRKAETENGEISESVTDKSPRKVKKKRKPKEESENGQPASVVGGREQVIN